MYLLKVFQPEIGDLKAAEVFFKSQCVDNKFIVIKNSQKITTGISPNARKQPDFTTGITRNAPKQGIFTTGKTTQARKQGFFTTGKRPDARKVLVFTIGEGGEEVKTPNTGC
ncbi:MAG TPA: hypothetical protein VK668_15925 [Mucilaginibacter sp.]|nr:hypothetical protein [Mucilaginibacter sp.]